MAVVAAAINGSAGVPRTPGVVVAVIAAIPMMLYALFWVEFANVCVARQGVLSGLERKDESCFR